MFAPSSPVKLTRERAVSQIQLRERSAPVPGAATDDISTPCCGRDGRTPANQDTAHERAGSGLISISLLLTPQHHRVGLRLDARVNGEQTSPRTRAS